MRLGAEDDNFNCVPLGVIKPIDQKIYCCDLVTNSLEWTKVVDLMINSMH